MCGITGLVAFNNHFNLPAEIKKMNDAIQHRGPDGEGYLLSGSDTLPYFSTDTPVAVRNGNFNYSPKSDLSKATDSFHFALGHRRLSIIELSNAGHQPMANKEGTCWISYNGEIYNYLELRNELQHKGHVFISNSDTEVILHAYMEWGKDCVSKFNGMWAFVIYDASKNYLFGSRDRVGVKPMYYVLNTAFFAFASEQKAFFKLTGMQAEINEKAVFDFLVFNEIEYESEGMFKGILELQASHNFIFNLSDKSLKVMRYYQLPEYKNVEHFTSFEEQKELLRSHLNKSIDLRMRADVPVGSCLSGGMDSSTIVYYMNKLNSSERKLDLFTASFLDNKVDESNWARLMVTETDSNWHQVRPNAEGLAGDLNDLIYSQDLPLWSTSTYAQFSLMKAAKQNGVKVLLDGQGGDELFAGYPHQSVYYYHSLMKKSQWSILFNEVNKSGSFPQNWKHFFKQNLKQYAKQALPKRFVKPIFMNYFDGLSNLHPDFIDRNKERFEHFLEKAAPDLNTQLRKEMNNDLLKSYLKCEDRCSMWHSVESRTPFADDPVLIEFSMNLPDSSKINEGVNKFILRESMRNRLPDSIVNRKDKMGFLTPDREWITSITSTSMQEWNEKSTIFNMKGLSKDFNQKFLNQNINSNLKPFKIISFLKWQKLFNV